MKKAWWVALSLLVGQAAMAFPTWMGTYGIYKKHDDRANPGLFSIMMNQDYVGLQAEVGIQVNGGNWVMYPMKYVANIDGNSLWTFMPSFQFPGGATVKYFFHGFDRWGGHIWDSRNGLNYEFTTSPTPELPVSRIGDSIAPGDYTNATGITWMRPWNMALDIKIKNLGAPEAIGIVWTWNNWADHRFASATYESDLGNGFEQWGVNLTPAGFEYNHRSLGFIRWFPVDSTNVMNVTSGRVDLTYAIFYRVNGTWYWDNNGGKDYRLTIGNPVNPNDTDNDGLLDSWEMEYFGNLGQSATDNPDGDGQIGFPMANIIEMANGTNPNVGEDTSGRGVRLIWANAYPSKGGTVTLSYGMGNQGNPLFGKPIYAHVGHNGWKNVYQTAQLTSNGQTGRFEVTINVPADATEINVVFTDKAGSWDNHGGKDWKIPVRP
ncbi:MAG TPA: carbohydrate-binding protein [Kiritimatiellia bacterium]|nr:carbohydrate-binding protein [Kiritimatiellia bacterium]HMP35804.1 carbohydrate-binding protein [Kiritimatiellia bacterium]